MMSQQTDTILFLSTPSARRATRRRPRQRPVGRISIHALREEGDDSGPVKVMISCYFYPRPPRGGRLVSGEKLSDSASISIHALREEGDGVDVFLDLRRCDFYPRPPRGGRPNADLQTMKSRLISIHALREEGDSHTAVG